MWRNRPEWGDGLFLMRPRKKKKNTQSPSVQHYFSLGPKVSLLICGWRLELFYPIAWKNSLLKREKSLSTAISFFVCLLSGGPARSYDSGGFHTESSMLGLIRDCGGVCLHVLKLDKPHLNGSPLRSSLTLLLWVFLLFSLLPTSSSIQHASIHLPLI